MLFLKALVFMLFYWNSRYPMKVWLKGFLWRACIEMREKHSVVLAYLFSRHQKAIRKNAGDTNKILGHFIEWKWIMEDKEDPNWKAFTCLNALHFTQHVLYMKALQSICERMELKDKHTLIQNNLNIHVYIFK